MVLQCVAFEGFGNLNGLGGFDGFDAVRHTHTPRPNPPPPLLGMFRKRQFVHKMSVHHFGAP